MVSTASTRYKVEKQAVGENTNTWGDTRLNNGLETLDRGSKGYESLALTGDTTLTWSNYSATNSGQVSILKLTGSLTSTTVLTVPSTEWQWDSIINATGASVTVKTSAGTGVTIQNGYRLAAYCDATNVNYGSPTQVGGDVYAGGQVKNLTAGTATTDAVNKAQMDAAIAAATTSSTAGTVRCTSSDTTAKFLTACFTTQISGALSFQIATINSGSNEQTQITASVGVLGLTDGGRKTASFTASSNSRYQCAWASNGTITLPASPAQGDVIQIAVLYSSSGYTTSIAPNGKKINGSTSTLALGTVNETFMITYDATLGDWA
jgi:hypothetical protein